MKVKNKSIKDLHACPQRLALSRHTLRFPPSRGHLQLQLTQLQIRALHARRRQVGSLCGGKFQLRVGGLQILQGSVGRLQTARSSPAPHRHRASMKKRRSVNAHSLSQPITAYHRPRIRPACESPFLEGYSRSGRLLCGFCPARAPAPAPRAA